MIKYTKSDVSSSEGINRHQLVGRPVTQVGLASQVFTWPGYERSADRNPGGEPFICSAPIWRERGENQKSVRVKNMVDKFCNFIFRGVAGILLHGWHARKANGSENVFLIGICSIELSYNS